MDKYCEGRVGARRDKFQSLSRSNSDSQEGINILISPTVENAFTLYTVHPFECVQPSSFRQQIARTTISLGSVFLVGSSPKVPGPICQYIYLHICVYICASAVWCIFRTSSDVSIYLCEWCLTVVIHGSRLEIINSRSWKRYSSLWLDESKNRERCERVSLGF